MLDAFFEGWLLVVFRHVFDDGLMVVCMLRISGPIPLRMPPSSVSDDSSLPSLPAATLFATYAHYVQLV
jgi:hypothetical protein